MFINIQNQKVNNLILIMEKFNIKILKMIQKDY